MLSINRDPHEEEPWWEHCAIVLDTVCVHPKKVASRPARFDIVARRDFWTPSERRRDRAWRPRCVGLLELPPTAGRFYTSIPYGSMEFVLTAMIQGQYRYVLLSGPPLSRGKSLCQSMDFQRSVDLAEY